jgi:hypothetical protein
MSIIEKKSYNPGIFVLEDTFNVSFKAKVARRG